MTRVKSDRFYLPQRAPRERRAFRPVTQCDRRGGTGPLLLAQIDTALAIHGLSAPAFGRLAVGDPHLVAQLRAGRRIRYGTGARIRRCLDRLA